MYLVVDSSGGLLSGSEGVLVTALSEAVTNAVDHAYDEENDENKILVEATVEDKEKMVIKIRRLIDLLTKILI